MFRVVMLVCVVVVMKEVVDIEWLCDLVVFYWCEEMVMLLGE